MLLFKAGQNVFWLGVVDLTLQLALTEKSAAAALGSAPSLAIPTPGAAAAPAPSVTPPPQLLFPSPSLSSVAGQAAASRPTRPSRASWRTSLPQRRQRRAPDETVRTAGELEPASRGSCRVAAAVAHRTGTSAVLAGPASFPEMVADAMAGHFTEVGCDATSINGGFVRGDRAYVLGAALMITALRAAHALPKGGRAAAHPRRRNRAPDTLRIESALYKYETH